MLLVVILYGAGLLVGLVAVRRQFLIRVWRSPWFGMGVAILTLLGVLLLGLYRRQHDGRDHCRALGVEMRNYAALLDDAVATRRLAEIAGSDGVAACMGSAQ